MPKLNGAVMKIQALSLLFVLLLVVMACPQDANQDAQAALDLSNFLGFEEEGENTLPGGWGGGPTDSIFVDESTFRSGRRAVRIERNAASAGQFTSISMEIPLNFQGSRIELRGYLRTEAVSDSSTLWIRQDGAGAVLAYKDMQDKKLRGDTDWTPYALSFTVQKQARSLAIGLLLTGTGKIWGDDFEVLADGIPIWEAARLERPKTAIEIDHEFDKGSRIALDELSSIQVQNLVTLGKVWGVLKYHHPLVTTGGFHWDYELFRTLPTVLAANDATEANRAMLMWIERLGVVAPPKLPTKLREDRIHLAPDIAWIADDKLLGADLAAQLQRVLSSRPKGPQFFVSLAPGVGKPLFQNEPAYADLPLPDGGYQLLGLLRFWNIIEYWFPYRNQLDEDWDAVLKEFIPRIALARDETSYKREMLALIAKAGDSHVNLWNCLDVRPPEGGCFLPFDVRFIEGKAVVVGFAMEAAKESGLAIGDEIVEMDGIPVPSLVERWAPYYAASNQAARLRDIARYITRGECAKGVQLTLKRGGTLSAMLMQRVSENQRSSIWRKHDLEGEVFRLLSEDVAYLKLSAVVADDIPSYIEKAQQTKGLIIDIRNYPSEHVALSLTSRLITAPTEFVLVTRADLSNPGAFHWVGTKPVKPQEPHYAGQVAILVDEDSQSLAEYTAMALRASPRATVIGSTTAGADGDASEFALPGGLSTMISGIGIFYPDGTPTQRVGILPDKEVLPTIQGIAAGRDEVLEEAIRTILGSELSTEQIIELARPSNYTRDAR